MLWPLAESDHDWTTGHHLSTSPGEDPGISNHLQHTRLTSTLITNYHHLQGLLRGGGEKGRGGKIKREDGGRGRVVERGRGREGGKR